MKAFANLSIRNKLIGIILVATVVSAVSGFALVTYLTIDTLRASLRDSVELMAEAVAEYIGIYVKFGPEYKTDAEGDLNRMLSDLEEVTDAYIFTTQDRATPFASYTRSGEINLPERLVFEPMIEITEDGFVHSYTEIWQDSENLEEPQLLGVLFVRATTEAYDEQRQQILLAMAGILAVVLAAAAVLAWFLQGVISKPILYLAEMAQRISTNADYSVRVPRPGNDEIGVLYQGFNDMLEQIQKRQEELERSNRDLDQFAYVASHDLKAPLRAIATLSGWIEEDLEGKLSPEAGEQMRLLRSRVQRMDGLIEGILQYSRVGRMDSHGEHVDVGAMLQEIIEFLSPPSEFEVTVAPDMPVLVTKRLRLEQIFSNLINNAIKYHDRRDGKVDVSVRRNGRFYEFSVADDGPGIAEEHHEKVFMMFQTLQPRDQVESTGLGLSLVKKLVEEEGGSVGISSELGKGATFHFTWPALHQGESIEELAS